MDIYECVQPCIISPFYGTVRRYIVDITAGHTVVVGTKTDMSGEEITNANPADTS